MMTMTRSKARNVVASSVKYEHWLPNHIKRLVDDSSYLTWRLPTWHHQTSSSSILRRYHAHSSGTPTTSNRATATTTMETTSYKQYSIHQYGAHYQCQPMLEDVLKRFATRISFQDSNHQDSQKRRHIVDLGSADGTNSIRTLRWIVSTLKQYLLVDSSPSFRITFEEHPASNVQILETTLNDNRHWFTEHNIEVSVLLKSFYEPLFPKESVDLFVCYICLHWLDTNDTEWNVTDWKKDVTTQNEYANNNNFTFMNEKAASVGGGERYEDLAKRHLAKFLALRAQELQPGAEMLLMAVSQPNDFITPPSSSSTKNATDDEKKKQYTQSSSVLTTALQRCIRKGLVRQEVLSEVLIPYYCRDKQHVLDALEMAKTLELTNDNDGDETCTKSHTPGALLALVGDVVTFSVRIPSVKHNGDDTTIIGGDDTTMMDDLIKKMEIQDAANMFWSIHKPAIQGSSSATDFEMEFIQKELMEVFQELFATENSNERVVTVTYWAAVLRRKTRHAWK